MKTRILVYVLSLFTLLSCDDDEWEDVQQFADLAGTWVMTSSTSDEPLFDINGDGENSTDILEELSCRKIELVLNADATFKLIDNTWAFDSEGTVICSGNDSVSEGTWSLNKDLSAISLEFTYQEDKWSIKVPFQRNGDQMTCRLGISLFGFDSEGNQKAMGGLTTLERN